MIDCRLEAKMIYPHLKAIYQNGTLKLLEPLKLPEGSTVDVSVQPTNERKQRYMYPTNPQPAGSLEPLIGLISIGGDALADTEALYDEV
jgi:Protein of unknown function DUF104